MLRLQPTRARYCTSRKSLREQLSQNLQEDFAVVSAAKVVTADENYNEAVRKAKALLHFSSVGLSFEAVVRMASSMNAGKALRG